MNREMELNGMADDYVRARQGKLESLKGQAREVERQLEHIKREIAATAELSEQRKTYQPVVNGIPSCPACSLDQGRPVPLIDQPSQTEMDEWLCQECRKTFQLSPS